MNCIIRWTSTAIAFIGIFVTLPHPLIAQETQPPFFSVRLMARNIDTSGTVAQTKRAGTIASKLSADIALPTQSVSHRGTLPYIVQFTGPIREEWKGELRKAGVTIIRYVPENAFIIEIGPGQLESVAQIKAVQWIGEYRAEDKVELGLAARIKARQSLAATGKKLARVEAPDANEYVVTISTFSPADVDRIRQAVEGIGGVVLKTAQGTRRGLIRARLPLDSVPKLSALAEVEWIERYVEPMLNNNVTVDAPRMNVRTVWTNHGLTGTGQVVGIADTGLDTGNLSTMHPDFTNRIRAAFALGRSGDWSDSAWTIFGNPAGGHGTHVAGSVLGNGSAYSNGLFKGVAYGAELVMQSVMDSDGGLGGLPADLNSLFLQAYTNGARIHSDSWGAAVNGAYNTDCANADEFMWDHPDMLTVFAAGNEGVDADGDGVVDLGNGDAPGSAKNVLTVGATESDRPSGSGGYSAKTYGNKWPGDFPVPPISNDVISTSADGIHQGMAAFSSRGPCDDGRFKPDIVAPGTDIISCRARVSGATKLWGTGSGVLANAASNYYSFCGGTSMSTPLTAGSAALVRQYFVERCGMTNPSAALIKATLLAGARSLSPGQYGDGAAREIQGAPRPNNVEGWGQVNLGDSLFPSTGYTNIFYDGTSLTTGGTNAYSFTASGDKKLSVVLAWTDYPGTPAAATKLVNDLDLVVILPDGTTNHAFGKATADRINNVEGLDLDPAPAGNITIKVIGFNVPNGPQPYALVIRTSAKSPLAKATSPSPANGAISVVPSPNLALSWGNGGGATSYKIYFGANPSPGTSEYQGTQTSTFFVPGAVGDGTYYWRIDACDALTTVTGDVWSFTVDMNVAASDGTYTNKVLVSWRSSPGATGYQVWRHTTNNLGAATLMGLASSANYTDSNTVAEASYWYWIRATNAAYSSGFGGPDVGWCRGATSNVTYYVSLAGSDHNRGDSWVQAKQSVQAAVNTAISGDLVLVTNGTHQLTAEINVRPGLTVRSVNGASVTTLLGGGSRGGFRCAYVAGGATLDGFTLTNGYVSSSEAAPPGVWPPYYYGIGPCGGGAWVDGGVLQNCTVVGNTVVGLAFETYMANGGGVEVTHGGVVQSSTIQRNTVITDYLFGPDARGGGISISDGTVMSCTVSGNRVYGPFSYGGGIYGNGTVRNCLIMGNRAEADNWAKYGGGVDLTGGEIENCTVVGNTGSQGGGLCIQGGIARNVVAYYNSGSDVYVPYNSTNSFAYGCYGIPSYYPVIGDGITTNVPLFVSNGSGYGANFVAGDYHLQSVSPCINTGANRLWMTGATDLDGNPRIMFGTVDMGAYEATNYTPTKIIGLTGNLAFGNVVTGQTATSVMTIINSGNSPLTVTNISYPACFSGTWTGAVAAGKATNVTVTFAPSAVQSYSGTIAVFSDATSGANTISCTGTGIAPTRVIGLLGNLAFGNVVTGQTATSVMTITNSGNSLLTVTNISYPTCYSGTWTGAVAAGKATNVTVTFAPSAVQSYGGTLTVFSDATSGTNTISCSGTGIAFGPLDHFAWALIPSTQYLNMPFSVMVTARDSAENTVADFDGPVMLAGVTANGQSVNGTILNSPTYTKSANYGTYTLGYSFTPSTNLTVTHVRSFAGSKVSIWTDAGTLLVAQNITNSPGTWSDTPLSTPITLSAGTTYRIGTYTAGTTYYWRSEMTNVFGHGTINGSYNLGGDGFPTYSDSAHWWFVDLRYAVSSVASVSIVPTNSGSFVSGVWSGAVTVLEGATNMYLRANDGAGHFGVSGPFNVLSAGTSFLLTAGTGPNGDVSPTSTNVPAGQNASFVLTPNQYYHIELIQTNGWTIGSNFGPMAYTYVWSNVLATGTLYVTFAENMGTNFGTPYTWLARYGYTNEMGSAELLTGSNGMPVWQSYVADLNPTNPASRFVIVAFTNGADGSFDVTFNSSTGRLYSLQTSTNLFLTNGWFIVSGASNVWGTGGTTTLRGTNKASPEFYRIRVQVP